MAKYPNDDLFESTKMSFGDHLEELRVSLFRAVIGLVIGFGIGLLISTYVMKWMQSPLTKALQNYYIEKAVDDLVEQYGENEVTEDVKKFVRTNRFVYDDIVIEADEVNRLQRALRRVQGVDAPPVAESSPQDEASTATAAAPVGKPEEKTSTEETLENSEPPASKLLVDMEKIPTPHSGFVRSRIWKPVKMDVRSLNAQEAFMIWMKAGFISGIVVASPWIFWQIWQFVAAGLYPHEKNYVYIYLPFSLLLFLAGGSLAFFFVFDPVLQFLFSFNKTLGIDPDPRISEWLGFVLILPLGFGISFQLPLVMLFLNRLGIFSLHAYVDKWRVAVLAIFVISAVLTPADPISIFLMAIPLTLLYFLGLGLCKWMPRGKNPFTAALDELET